MIARKRSMRLSPRLRFAPQVQPLTRNGDRQNPRTKPAHRRPRRPGHRPGIGTCRSNLTRRERVLALQRTDVQQVMAESEMGDVREALVTRYLRHTALGGLVGTELDEAETTYVLWDWDGLALLAYAQFLKHGRGAFLGPRTMIDENAITVVFDYVLGAGGSELGAACSHLRDRRGADLGQRAD